MFYKKQRESITTMLHSKLRHIEHAKFKNMKRNADRRSKKEADFKNHHGYSGNYILNDVVKAAQVFYNHTGNIDWQKDPQLELTVNEYIKMLDNMVTAGMNLSPLLIYFHSKVSKNAVPAALSYQETTQKYGTTVNGYLDYQSRPAQLQDIENFVL